jgi:hypothetical protein
MYIQGQVLSMVDGPHEVRDDASSPGAKAIATSYMHSSADDRQKPRGPELGGDNKSLKPTLRFRLEGSPATTERWVPHAGRRGGLTLC